jgi:hypothetical protein
MFLKVTLVTIKLQHGYHVEKKKVRYEREEECI